MHCSILQTEKAKSKQKKKTFWAKVLHQRTKHSFLYIFLHIIFLCVSSDKEQLLEIAKANAAAMCAKAGMPIPASLRSAVHPLALPNMAMNAAVASMTAGMIFYFSLDNTFIHLLSHLVSLWELSIWLFFGPSLYVACSKDIHHTVIFLRFSTSQLP